MSAIETTPWRISAGSTTPAKMKFNEDEIIRDLKDYIEKTYNGHYSNELNEVMPVDVWQALGSLSSTSRDMAIKYLMRFGKKDGNNVVDLYKAIHFIIYMIYAEGQQDK